MGWQCEEFQELRSSIAAMSDWEWLTGSGNVKSSRIGTNRKHNKTWNRNTDRNWNRNMDKETHSEIGSTHWTQLAHSYLLIARTGSCIIKTTEDVSSYDTI